MKFLLKILQKNEHHFHKGGKLHKLYPLWEAQETILFTPADVTEKGPHVRDAMDIKRLMITVVVALIPCLIFGMYNAGYQSARALGILDQLSVTQIMLNGAYIVLPIVLVSYITGGIIEPLFSVIRRHPVSEGFLVTGMLFPLTLPPTIPLWQVAVGMAFGITIGKEIFGGTGMNILNPALTGRAFLFFSFAPDISGADPWVVINPDHLLFTAGATQASVVDGFTGATALLAAADVQAGGSITSILADPAKVFHTFSFENLFIGLVPGSIGETSALMCLIGAAILLVTRVGSGQIMLGVVLGGVLTSLLAGALAGDATRPFLSMGPHYHLVMGGFLFGTVYMATDPVSAAATGKGKYIYGFLIGMLTILIRLVNPAYPEGMMLSILLMNIFAPLIDHYVVQGNIKRRLKRATAG